jgi:hypothetical protein
MGWALHRLDVGHQVRGCSAEWPLIPPSSPRGRVEAGGEGGQFAGALGEAEPGRAVVRQFGLTA